ncbi:hypothetical protein HDU76_000079 [Blyttiomyces sp. JEL0837]|nr:hypothetical protein HDU76_000079 [Blyttiomyces sp. JEL0837]
MTVTKVLMNHVLIDGNLVPLNPATGRPDVGPAVQVVNEKGVPVLGPLHEGEHYRLAFAWDLGKMDWATKAALKCERAKWEEMHGHQALILSSSKGMKKAFAPSIVGAVVSSEQVKLPSLDLRMDSQDTLSLFTLTVQVMFKPRTSHLSLPHGSALDGV